MFEDISNISYTDKDGKSTIHRLVMGLGHRFYRCSINLDKLDPSFRPAESMMSLEQLLSHISDLILFSLEKFGGHMDISNQCGPEEILNYIDALQAVIVSSDVEDMNEDFFYLINGPLSDAISHVGQVNMYKRIAGVDAPNDNYYKGFPA